MRIGACCHPVASINFAADSRPWAYAGKSPFPDLPTLSVGTHFVPKGNASGLSGVSAYAAIGAGTNIILIDPEWDLIVVARWVSQDSVADLIAAVISAIA